MKKNIKIASAMTAAVMAFSVFAAGMPAALSDTPGSYEITASAASVIASGICGANNNNDMVTSENMNSYDYNSEVKWEIFDNGGKVNGETAYTLIISGDGAMADFEHDQYQPWFHYSKNVTDVYVIDGVTSIGLNAFSNYNGQFRSLNIACIGKSVRKIDKWAFEVCSNLSYIYFEGAETLRNGSAGSNGWNIYNDGDDENNPFYGCGTGSSTVTDGKHMISVLTQTSDKDFNDSLAKAINVGAEFKDKIGIEASVRYDFPIADLDPDLVTMNDRKNLLTNVPEGTECYRRILQESVLYLIKMDADDLNSLTFSQFKGSSYDDLFIKLPEGYKLNQPKLSKKVNLRKYELLQFPVTYQYVEMEKDPGTNDVTAVKVDKPEMLEESRNFYADYMLSFGGNTYNFYPVTHTSNYTQVAAKAPTCVEQGNIGYWYDEANDKYYSDPSGKNVTTKEAVTLPATGQHKYEDGRCINCGKYASRELGYTIFKEDGIFYNVYPTYAEVADCDDNMTEAVIKSQVNNVPVTEIGENSFNSKKQLTKVVIPETVTTIKKSAFWGASALEAIDIPETVTAIENGAFTRCSALKDITVRNPECAIGQSTSTVSNSYDYKTSLYNYEGTIYGYDGSTAQAYAQAHNYKFTLLSATAEDIAVDETGNITWNRADGAVAYRIIKTYNNKTYYGKKTTDTSYKMNFDPKVRYELCIRSYNAEGIYTDSEPIVVETKGLEIAKEPALNEKGVLSWEPVKNAVSYRIVKSWGGKTYYSSKTEDCMMAVKYDSQTSYKFCVRAYDAQGNYTDGAVLNVQGTALGKVTDVSINKNGEIVWSSIPNAVAYRVGMEADGKTYYSAKVTGTSYILNSIPKRDYRLFVIAYNVSGKASTGPKTEIKYTAE